jgi:plastocyanin
MRWYSTLRRKHMRRQYLDRTVLLGILILSGALLAGDVEAQQAATTHTIFMNAVEYKGTTTTEKLAPPSVNPATLSKGYVYKGPGEADQTAPQQWEIDSYAFSPGFMTVYKGDTVALSTFVVNGDKHEVAVLAPDGQVVVPTAPWTRGQEYRVSFVADKVGTYHLSCSIHAPTMTASILVLPR